jgi:3-hydroxyisobutyrate dehydrogenase
MSEVRVALIGLGVMGAGMAASLLRAGFKVALYNRDPSKAAPFAASARLADSPRTAAEGADIIISMVADDDASRAVWLGEEGALKGAAAGAVCIEASTLTSTWIAQWAHAVLEHGCAPLDAPVTGSRVQADAGELNFIVGGSPLALEKARPALAAMGKSITLLGATGSGALFKLINNFLCGVQLASFAEALAMIERSGLDRDAALGLLTNGAPGSPLVKGVAGRVLAGDETLNFRVRLMAKDLHYAVGEAGRMSLELITARTAHSIFTGAVTAGFGEQDISTLYKFVGGGR